MNDAVTIILPKLLSLLLRITNHFNIFYLIPCPCSVLIYCENNSTYLIHNNNNSFVELNNIFSWGLTNLKRYWMYCNTKNLSKSYFIVGQNFSSTNISWLYICSLPKSYIILCTVIYYVLRQSKTCTDWTCTYVWVYFSYLCQSAWSESL